MDKEKKRTKMQLDKELQHVTFNGVDQVLSKWKKKSLRERIDLFLNKEMEINVVPVSLALMLIVLPLSFGISKNESTKERKIVEIAGNHYWEEDIKRRVNFNED